jgi:hypothetical protein
MWTVLFMTACGGSTPAPAASVETEQPGDISLPLPENGYQIVTPKYTVPAFTEEEICSVIRLEPKADEQMYWVSALESLVTEGTHHMNVMIGEFSFLDAFVEEGASADALGADLGQYPCADLNTMERAYNVFPSQRQNQRITMPAGVAAPLTAPMVFIFSHHYVNPTDSPVDIQAIVNIETVPGEEVTHVASLVFDDIPDLEVPPGQERVISRTCIFERDVEVALVSTHNHEWGECATVNHYDGTTDTTEKAPFFVNKLWEQPPILHFEQGTFPIAAGNGVTWSCHFRNNTDRTLINDGTAEGEMCVFAAVTYPSPWTTAEVESTVASGDLAGLITLMNDVMGSCDTSIAPAEELWASDDASGCEDLDQTESNVLEP